MNDLDVLMPVRNGGERLRLAVHSTFRALGASGRILVIDDGSTDETASVLRELARRYGRQLLVLSNPVSVGVAESLNVLLHESDARLIARMDADDICLPWRFAHQVRALSSDRELLFGGYVKFGTFRSIFRQPLPIKMSSEAARESLAFENPFCHPTLLCHSAALRSIGGYQSARAEDYLTWITAMTSDISCRRTGVPVLLYRVSPGQTSGTAAWKDAARTELKGSAAWGAFRAQAPGGANLSRVEQRVVRRIRARAGAV